MNREKYIGLDVHQATIVVAVLDSAGKLVMESILETEAATILQFDLMIAQSVTANSTQQPVYTWKNVRIVGGGFITGIEAHPWIPELFYARTDIGGSYRWNPFTQTWLPLTDWVTPDNWDLQGTLSIALDPTNPFNVYLAQGEYVESWAPPTGGIIYGDIAP